jgi:4-hydroxy-3-polyprenylbenzoate decarboxylase
MTAVTEMGGIIAPPVPAFYARPESLAQMVDHSLGRVLDLFGLDAGVAADGKNTKSCGRGLLARGSVAKLLNDTPASRKLIYSGRFATR